VTKEESVKIKSSLHSLNTLSGVTSERCHLRGFAPGHTHQGYNDGESLATCRRFDRLEIDLNPILPAPEANVSPLVLSGR